MTLPRLRQVVLVAADLDAVAAQLESHVDVSAPFRDEGVGHFGLRNAVYAVGDCFIEIVSPVRDDTAAGRYRERRGGDCGYMAMFEVADEKATRARLAELGVRIVWDTTHDDIVDLHLHPRDVPPAIVALDVTSPVGSWRWGGPAWTATTPAHDPGGVIAMEVAAVDPAATANRWAAVLGVETGADNSLSLAGGDQQVSFVPAADRSHEGIIGATVSRPGTAARTVVAGVEIKRISTEGAA
ncbi:MAG: VOC family protein [Frankiales bacterium]|nr:VOC family protein [Frankiales bacterium]